MDNQNVFKPIWIRRVFLLLIVILLAGVALAGVLAPIAWANTSVFVRPGGDDIRCNGSANLDYAPDIAPNCAVQTLQRGLSLGSLNGTVIFTDGADRTTIPVNNEISIAATSLSVSKSASSDPIDVGNPLTYTVTVTNTGGSSATVTLLDFLPTPLGFVAYVNGSATPSQGGCGLLTSIPPTISCTLGILNPGLTATVTIPVTPTAAGTAVNEAQVVSPDAPSRDDKIPALFKGDTDLSVSKSDFPDPVPVGQPLTYTVTITNNGPVAVASVTLTDKLPANTVFVSSIPPAPDCTQVSKVITCTLGLLDVNANTTVTIVVTPTVDGIITNTATVTGSGNDLVTGNNVATQTTTVLPAANLSISKSDAPDPVNAGNILTYTLTVVNNGPSSAQNVVVTDTLPLSVSVTNVDPTTNTQIGQQVGWNLGLLNNGETRRLTVAVTVDSNASGIITNTAVVTSSTLDLILNNNVTTSTTTVSAGGPTTVYLPIILKNFAGAFAYLQWDGLEPVRDRVTDKDDGDGLNTDTHNDGVFKLYVNLGSQGPKSVSDVRLASTQGVEWDTLTPNTNPVLGIYDGGNRLNNADGTISRVLPNVIIIHLYASDSITTTSPPRFPPDTYTYTVTINFTDNTSLVAQATIPPSAPTTPPTSLSYVSDVVVDPDSNQVFVASPRHSWVYVIDGSSNTITRTVPVGNGPTGLTVLTATVPTNHKIFAAHQYGVNNWRPGIKVFGVNESSSHNAPSDGYVGSAPVKIAANGTNGRVYVSNYFDKLAVINGNSESKMGWVIQKGYQGAYGLDTSTDTNRVYLATRDTGELVVFDGGGDRLLLQPNYIPTHIKPPQPCSLWSVAVNESTDHVFVPCPQRNKVYVLQENQISMLSLEALGVLEERDGNYALVISPAAAPWIAEVDVGISMGQEGIAVDTNTGYVFITSNNALVVLQDGASPSHDSTVTVGSSLQGVDVNPVTQKVYVGDAGNNTVIVLEATPPFTHITTIPLTP